MNKNTKIIILAVVTVLSSVIAWHSLSTVFHLELTIGSSMILQVLTKLLYPLFAFCLFLALVSISSILVKSELILTGVWFLSGLPVFLFFPFSPWLLIIILLLTVSFLYYSVQIRSEVKSYISFSLFKILRWGLGLVILAVMISISLSYYITVTTEQRNTEKEAINSLVESATSLANQIIPSRFENYNPDMTLDEFIFQMSAGTAEEISGQLNKQLQESFGNPYEENSDVLVEQLRQKLKSGEIKESQLPPEILNNLNAGTLTTDELVSSEAIQGIFQTEIANARDEFLKNIGIEAKGNDRISDVLTKIIREYAFQYLGPYERFITPLLALSLFFALSVFTILYKSIIRIFALIIYHFLLSVNFVNIKKEKREVNLISLE